MLYNVVKHLKVQILESVLESQNTVQSAVYRKFYQYNSLLFSGLLIREIIDQNDLRIMRQISA